METCGVFGKYIKCFDVIELPIRDGNHTFKFSPLAYSYVIELPIRDGNSLPLLPLIRSSKCY